MTHPSAVIQSNAYAAEVIRSEGEEKPWKVIVHHRNVSAIVSPSVPQIPTRYFYTYEMAKDWAKEAVFRSWKAA